MKLKIMLAFALLAACGPPRQPQTAAPDTPVLRVMTYNLNYGVAGDGATLDAIASQPADIVLLQETNEAWEVAIRKRYAKDYRHIEFVHCCGAGGLGVLSRVPIESRAVLEPPKDGWFPAWHLVFDTALGRVQALNVHLRPPISNTGSVVSGYFSTRQIRAAEIDAYWAALDPKLPTIVAGDFNEKNGKAISFLRSEGLESVLPMFAPSAKTWRWQTSVGQVSTRLDHVLVDDTFEPLNAEVINAGRSDHLPVVVTLARK